MQLMPAPNVNEDTSQNWQCTEDGGAARYSDAHRRSAPQGAALSQAQLLAASPIQSDLGVVASAGANRSVSLPVFVNDTRGGVRLPDWRHNPAAWYQQLCIAKELQGVRFARVESRRGRRRQRRRQRPEQ